MTEILSSQFIEYMGGYVSMDTLIQGAFELINDVSKVGSCLYIKNSGGLEYRSTPTKEAKYLVNFTSGGYFGGSEQEISTRLPFDAGLEGVGLIAAVGDDVKNLEVGTPAAIMNFGAYAEFIMVPAELVFPVARPDPEVVAMLISGLTASVALEKAAQMESGKTVLVTAAAGGTGQFAVQVAKLAGNKVVATCGGKDKATLLRDLGVDRVIDYKEESIENVAIDPKSFVGVQSVADAVEYLHSGKSVGKVIVCIDPNFSQQATN
ncbi:hypothetical protein L2E82_01177 [Cichorium intybus]|uniref:Uncharacterized protein n=1 Tax=Cichorium intybus TaxID=13427 RepID=A0ACB9H0B5_CICIN|nr:hypothetical protein L2E82_01177 [Cichorium intybus]